MSARCSPTSLPLSPSQVKCCGLNNYTDFTGSPWNKENNGYPPACCNNQSPCNETLAAERNVTVRARQWLLPCGRAWFAVCTGRETCPAAPAPALDIVVPWALSPGGCCGFLGLSLAETSKAATIALVRKGPLQLGGMTGAEHELRHHYAFLSDFPVALPPTNTVLWPEKWLRCCLKPPDLLHGCAAWAGELYLPFWGCYTPVFRGSLPFACPHLCGYLSQGCFHQILEEIRTNAGVVGGVAAGIAALEVSA